MKELIPGSAATEAVAVAVHATSTTVAATSLPDRPAEPRSEEKRQDGAEPGPPPDKGPPADRGEEKGQRK